MGTHPIARLARAEAGQGMAEYALLAGLIAIVCIAAITIIGVDVSTTINNIASAITGGS
jgi:Flp pilus assembly pilin Flp